MRAYYGSRISENMTETPEGFLVCHHVPIARTGYQEYLAHEIGLDGNEIVKVFRSPEEVFSKATLASFEGKPVALGHPSEDVTPSNSVAYLKGHVQNVRRGSGEEEDLIIADLFITDKLLIQRIQEGLREVSCGYQCTYQEADGGYEQQEIRGNHVAVVEAGRAGDRVAIKDEEPARPVSTNTKPERRKKVMGYKTKPSIWDRIRGIAATDADPAELAEIAVELNEMAKEESAAPDQEPEKPAADNTEPAGTAIDEETMAKIADMVVQRLGDTLAALKPSEDDDPLDELLEEVEAKQDSEESVTVEAGELPGEDEDPESTDDTEEENTQVDPADVPDNPIPGADAARRKGMADAIRALKPFIASLPKEQRRAASDAAAKELRKAMKKPPKGTNDNYAALNKRKPKSAADARPAHADDGSLGVKIMEARNPHYKKDKK